MEIELTFTEPKKGKLPISKDKNGKIHLLDWDFWRSHKVKPGETWLCEITTTEVRKCIVQPIKIINSKSYNFVAMKSMAEKLKNKYSVGN
jgi:hypothetical protein